MEEPIGSKKEKGEVLNYTAEEKEGDRQKDLGENIINTIIMEGFQITDDTSQDNKISKIISVEKVDAKGKEEKENVAGNPGFIVIHLANNPIT